MATGIDTSFLVAVEVTGHPDHFRARGRIHQMAAQSAQPLALAPQVLAEFVHIVTDPRRFPSPLDMPAALQRAEAWWNATEVVQVSPGDMSMITFFGWMNTHQLGRKRLLDTMLAATYYAAGINSLLTLNADDFKLFGCFDLPTI